MNYPPAHRVPAAPEGKEWYRVRKGLIEEGDWLGDMHEYAAGAAAGAVGSAVEGLHWIVYRLRDIPKPRTRTRYFTHATKFYDTTAYIRYVGEKGAAVRTDGTESEHRPVGLATAVEWSKEGDWKEITAKEALALTKPAPAKKSEAELLRAEAAALKAENATLWANEKTYVAKIADLQNKLAAARAAVETLKSL